MLLVVAFLLFIYNSGSLQPKTASSTTSSAQSIQNNHLLPQALPIDQKEGTEKRDKKGPHSFNLNNNIPRNRVEAVRLALGTQDPPKEKRDKEILEEDYNSYDSKNVEENKNANNNEPQNNDNPPEPEPPKNPADDNNQNPVDNNNVNDQANDPPNDQANDPGYPENQDSNNAEETYKDFEEGMKGDDGGKRKSLVPDFKGPTNDRQTAVVNAFKHAWGGYKKYAWGHDHLRPISKSAQNWFGLGLTIVDSLDTMLIMGLQDEFNEARDWIGTKLQFGINKDVNLFETTIRVLGGLLSAYHLSNEDEMFLDKARDLGDRLLGSFGSPSGIPYSDVNLQSSKGHAPKWSPDSSTSEVTTIQLEFRDLSRLTGDPKYESAVEAISQKVHALLLDEPAPSNGLVPIFINANTGKFRNAATITLGARGDSYYEYLLKQWLQTGKTQNYLKEDFLKAATDMLNRLAKRTEPNKLLFLGELVTGGKDFKPKMDELVCFLPGTLALGYYHGLNLTEGQLPPISDKENSRNSPQNKNLLLEFAEELAYTCYLTFARQPTHLAPEITYFNTAPNSAADFYVKSNDAHYLLRPETIESLWYLYYITGNKTYQDWGWNIFQGIEKYTKVLNGYTTVGNVRNALDLRPRDMMESFFLGETLKYLYLLFSDQQEIDLKQWVFNTEAHPLPIYRD